MKDLANWLARLSALSAENPPVHRFHRVAAPSPVAYDTSIVRFHDAEQAVYSFGSIPTRLAVVNWMDDGKGDAFRDHGVASELGALLSLALNRRIQVAASDVPLHMKGSDNRFFLPMAQLVDRSLTGPIDGDVKETLEQYLALVLGLDASDQAVLGAAMNLHYASVLLHDIDLNAAYALSVAGIERLSRAYGDAPTEWAEWPEAGRFDAAFAEIELTREQADRLRLELLSGRQLRLRQTFAAYTAGRLPEEFWTMEIAEFTPEVRMEPDGSAVMTGVTSGPGMRVEQLLSKEPDVLRRRLLSTYDARSSYVHEGARELDLRSALGERIGQTLNVIRPIDFVFSTSRLRRNRRSCPGAHWSSISTSSADSFARPAAHASTKAAVPVPAIIIRACGSSKLFRENELCSPATVVTNVSVSTSA